VARFNEQTGQLTMVDSAKADNPSYLCIAPSGKKIYALSENAGTNPGSVSAFNFDQASGRLSFINSQVTGGDHPCFVSIDAKGKFLAVANYSGGSVTMIPVDGSGALLPYSQLVQHTGKGANPQRQEKPHVHQAVFSPKQNHLVVNDLGTDEVKAYAFNPKKAQPLDTQKVIKIRTEPGSGPRHLVFHPAKPIFYVMEELSGKVSVHAFGKHSIALLQTIDCDTISRQPGSADIHISPDGRFLYASNRADANTITIFSVNDSDGRLQRVGSQPVNGLGPRNFVIHPSGNWLLVANQRTNNIVVFARNAQTGLLTQTGAGASLPAPVCLVFAEK
jgi:6-phosphogluconolactonase